MFTRLGRLLWSNVRSIGVTLVVLSGAAFFLFWVRRFVPIEHWLAWRYAMYWALALGFWLSSVSAGQVLLRRLLGRYLPFGEHLVLSAALGALAFGCVWFLLGIAHAFRVWSFVLVPVAFLAVGARPALRWIARYRRHGALLRRKVPGRMPGWLSKLALGFGVLAFGLLYATILTPDNVAYDARWYHLAAAEQYAVQHGLRPFLDGWFVGAYPQLATWIYSWAFLLPTGRIFDQVELAAHLELIGFTFTLLGIPVLVRRILGGGGYGLSWVVRFLFPGVFLYDSGLAGGADHLAAFWAIPVFLCFLRAYERVELRRCLLLAACLAGALLTKYSAASLALFPVLAMLFRAATLAFRERRAPGGLLPLRNLALTALAGLALTAPHWLKNWIWYHDPVYPLASGTFSPRPWTVDTADRFGHFMPANWSAPHSLQGVQDTLKALVNHSFVVHDWPEFHGAVPVFGSLFTLAVPCLLFLKPRRRLLALVVSCHVGIGVWYWMFHQDRYLQTLLPWMSVGTACIGIAAWRLGRLPRVAIGLLVAAQLAWGGDTPFIPAHSLSGGTPYKAALELLSSSYRGNFEARFEVYAPLGQVKQHVAPGGTVMLHETHLHLGIGVPTVSDWIGWQGGVSYVRSAKPSEMYALLRGMGVTDLLWSRASRGYDSVGGDIAFYYFATRYTRRGARVGPFIVSRLPDAAPSDQDFQNQALFLGCGDHYASGLYRISELSVTVIAGSRVASDYPAPLVPLAPGADLDELLRKVDAVVSNVSCFALPKALSNFGLEPVAERDGNQIWVRSPPARKRRAER